MRRSVLLADRLRSVVSPDMRLVLPNQNPGYNKLWCGPVLSRTPVCAKVVQCVTVHQGKHAVSIKCGDWHRGLPSGSTVALNLVHERLSYITCKNVCVSEN